MTTYHSFIQYVPNPISNERINIGVITFDDYNIKTHWLSDWDRVRSFSFNNEEHINFLKDFISQMERVTAKGLLFPEDQPSNQPRYKRLQKMVSNESNCIQFTQPKIILEGVDPLIVDRLKKYLDK